MICDAWHSNKFHSYYMLPAPPAALYPALLHYEKITDLSMTLVTLTRK